MLLKQTKLVLLGLVLSLFAIAVMVQSGEAASSIVLKLAHAHTPTESIIGTAATLFAERVQKLTNGKVEIQVFHSGQLGSNEREMAESVKLGVLDMAIPASSVLTGYSPIITLFDLPFIFENHAHAIKVLDGPIGQKIKDEFEPKGIVILEYWSAGIRNVFNNVRPVRNPDDLKGMKIRVMQTPVYLDTFKALGALPVAMASSELYSALQLNAVDAGENDPASVMTWKWVEVIKYYSLTQHAYCPMTVIINAKLFRSFPKDIQQAIQIAGREASAHQRPYVEGLWDRAMKRIEAKGVKINKVDDLSVFREKVKHIYDKYDKELGGNLIKLTMDAAQVSR